MAFVRCDGHNADGRDADMSLTGRPRARHPLQNRMTPAGEIIATAHRGTMMGNRGGCLHEAGELGPRRWASRRWICCRLSFKGRRRQVMSPGRYTELFFLDEATALAAGHRPCFECRREDALRFQQLWAESGDQARAPSACEMDRELHRERLASGGTAHTTTWPPRGLPDGAMLRTLPAQGDRSGDPSSGFALVWKGRLRPWTPAGYLAPLEPGAPAGKEACDRAQVVTPPRILRILALGYAPIPHPSLSDPVSVP